LFNIIAVALQTTHVVFSYEWGLVNPSFAKTGLILQKSMH